MMPELDYKSLFSANRNPLLVLDDTLSIMAVNQAYMSATGISESKSLGRNIFEVFPAHPHGAGKSGEQKLRVSLERVLETGVIDEMAITKYEIPAGNSASGGFEERFWKLTNTPLLNYEGKLTHILVHAEDVTNFMQAESRHRFAH